MQNFQQRGEHLRLYPSDSVKAGEVVVVGEFVGVAFGNYDIADEEGVVCDMVGVYELPKATGAWTQGQKLFYNATAKTVGTVETDAVFIGHAAEPATNDAAFGSVRLKG